MNVSLKKLLSFVVAVAMIASMIVPMNITTAKAETSVIPEAAQAEIAKGKLVQEKSAELHQAGTFSGTGEVQAICPVCYANGDISAKTWLPITKDLALTDNSIAIMLSDSDGSNQKHYYFAEDFVRDYYIPQDGMFARSGCINLNGKTITLNGAKLITLYSGKVASIMDTAGNAVVTGSGDLKEHQGRTLNVLQDGAVLNLYGGTYKGMNDTHTSGGTDKASPTVAVTKGALNIYEGTTIVGVDGTTGNTGSRGGSVYVNSGAEMNMYGGIVKDGKGSYGGNIYVQRDSATAFATFNMYAGKVVNGYSTYAVNDAGGGNIMLKGVMNLYDGEILGGTCGYGGNIYMHGNSTMHCTLNMYGGFIAGGTASKGLACGNNVYIHGYGNATSGYNISAEMNMSGGIIVGYIATFASYKNTNGSAKHKPNFSGTARLVPYGVDSQGTEYTATTTLTNTTFSSASITTGGILFGGALDKAYGYCQDCGKASVAYTVVTTETKMTAGGHYIFLGSPLDYTFATPDSGSSLLQTSAAGKVCIDLNGADIKVHKGRFLYLGWGGTVNIRDSAGGAVVSGSYDWFGTNGATIQTGDLQSSDLEVNVFGGTYKKFQYEGDPANGTHNPNAIVRVRQRCTFNLYEGAVIDGSDVNQAAPAAVFIGNNAGYPSTFNLKGGTVYGGTNTNGDGDAFRVGNSANTATLNIESGLVVGAGDKAIQVRNGATLNISGGTISGEGDSVASYLTNTVSISGGTMGTVDVTEGSTLTLSGKPVIGMLYTNGVLANVDGLSTEADITVSAGAGTVLTAATETDIGNAIKHSNPELLIKKNADGQYYVANAYPDPVEGQFDPEHCGGLAYCPICGDDEPVLWTAVTEPTVMDGGHYYLADNINKDYANDSDNSFITGHGTINLNGKTVTINAGRFLSVGAGTTEVIDTEGGAMITGSANRYDNNGATIKVDGTDAILNLRAGTYKATDDTVSGTDTDTTGSLLRVRTGTLNLYEGAVIDGAGYDKVGNYSLVYIGHTSGDQAFNMYGGEIKNGTSAQYGGNVYIRQGKTFTMSGGAILNGKAMQGGNVYIASTDTTGGTFNMTGGFIGGGTATSGSGNYGSNVGLQTYKKTDGTYVNNTTFSMTGGTIAGGVAVCWGQNLANKTFTITGTARIVPEVLYEGVTYTETVGLCKVNFDSSEAEKGFEVWVGQTLANTYVWCDHCEDVIKWTNLYSNASPVASASGHIRFMDDVNYTFAENGNKELLTISGNAYIDLQGHDVTIDGGRFIGMSSKATVDVIDSEGGAIVTGSNDYYSGWGLTITVNYKDAVLNLYGGTYRGMNDTSTAVSGNNGECKDCPVVRMRDGGTINLYEGATIDGLTNLEDRSNATVFIGHSATNICTFNLEGGTVIGGKNLEGENSGDGGAFRVGNGANSAILNVNSGTIIGGQTSSGDAIQVREGCTVNIGGGLIVGGEGSADSLIWNYGTLNINGGVIVGEVRVEAADKQTTSPVTILSGAPKIVTEHTVGDTTYTATTGLRLVDGLVADVNGLTAEASIRMTAVYNVPLTTAYTGSVDMTKVFVFKDAALLTQNEERQFILIVPTVVIDGVAYGSVEDALADYDIESGKAVIFKQSQVTISEDILLDVAASAENLVISGTGMVYGFDTTNDTYETYIKITVSGDVEVAPEATANGNRYMSLKEGSQYGFHRFVTKLTHVTLRTSAAGLYYKASYECDAVVRDRVLAHGVVLSTADMPGENFLADKGNLYTAIEGKFAGLYDPAKHTVSTTSGSVFGILKDTREAAVNTQYLTVDIYANSYFLVDRDGNGDTYFYMADTQNDGKKRTDEGFTGVARNLLEVVTAMNSAEFIAKLSAEQKTSLIGFANKWASYLDDAGKAQWAAATSNMKN